MRKLMSLVAFAAVFLLVFSSALAEVTIFSMDSSNNHVLIGKTIKINIIKENIKGQLTLSWTSSDESIATVKGGTVLGINAGTCIIKCEATNKSNGDVYTAECNVEVLTPVEKITPTQAEYNLPLITQFIQIGIAEDQEQVDYYQDSLAWIWPILIVEPSEASCKEISLTSSNNKVVFANENEIYPAGVGTATITAKSTDGSGAKCSFKVTVPEIYTQCEKIELTMGDAIKLGYKYNGNATYGMDTSEGCFISSKSLGAYRDLEYIKIVPQYPGEGWIMFTKNGKKLKVIEVIVTDKDDSVN